MLDKILERLGYIKKKIYNKDIIDKINRIAEVNKNYSDHRDKYDNLVKNQHELLNEHEALKKHVDKISEEKGKLIGQIRQLERNLEKYRGWEKNPYMFLDTLYPDLNIRSLELNITKEGTLIKKFDTLLATLDKAEQVDHMRDINMVINSSAFKREIDFIIQDIQVQKLNETKDSERGKLLLQILIFIAGLRKRFELLNTKFLTDNAPAKVHNRTHSIGSSE